MTTIDPDDEREERRRSRLPVILFALLAAAGAGAIGYWTAQKPSAPPQQQASAQPEQKQPEAATPPKDQAAATAEAPKQADPKQEQAAAPAEAPKPAEPVQQQASAPAEAPKPAESEPQVAAVQQEPQPEPKAEAPKPQPEVQVEVPQPEVQSEPEQAKIEPEPAPAPAAQAEAKPEPQPEPVQQAAVEPEPQEPTPAPKPAPAEEPAAATQEEPPSFDTVRVEPTGEAVIAGRAKPGAEVMVKHNGQVVGKTTAGSDGTFVVIPDKPLPAGAGALSLETEIGGSVQASSNTVAVAVKDQAKGEALVAVVKPDEPVKVIQAPTAAKESVPKDQVVLDSVDYDAEGNIVFSGRGNAKALIRVYVDNAPAGEVAAGDDGRWSFNGRSAIATGTHTLRVDSLGDNGKVLSRVELPFQREEPEKVAMATQPQSAPEPETPKTATEPETQVAAAPAAAPKIGSKTVGNSAVPQRMVIQPGNSLWRLSRMVYGKGKRYTVIWEANKGQIRNPDLIYPGQIFAVPVPQ